MISLGLRFCALSGVTAMLLMPDRDGLALWSVVITSLAGLIAQLMKNRDDGRREERRHRFEREDREATALVRKSIEVGLDKTFTAVAENTAITLDVGKKADQAYETANQAYETANHSTEKLAAVTAALAQSGVARQSTLKKESRAIREGIAAVAHSIEDHA